MNSDTAVAAQRLTMAFRVPSGAVVAAEYVSLVVTPERITVFAGPAGAVAAARCGPPRPPHRNPLPHAAEVVCPEE